MELLVGEGQPWPSGPEWTDTSGGTVVAGSPVGRDGMARGANSRRSLKYVDCRACTTTQWESPDCCASGVTGGEWREPRCDRRSGQWAEGCRPRIVLNTESRETWRMGKAWLRRRKPIGYGTWAGPTSWKTVTRRRINLRGPEGHGGKKVQLNLVGDRRRTFEGRPKAKQMVRTTILGVRMLCP